MCTSLNYLGVLGWFVDWMVSGNTTPRTLYIHASTRTNSSPQLNISKAKAVIHTRVCLQQMFTPSEKDIQNGRWICEIALCNGKTFWEYFFPSLWRCFLPCATMNSEPMNKRGTTCHNVIVHTYLRALQGRDMVIMARLKFITPCTSIYIWKWLDVYHQINYVGFFLL